MGLWNLVGNYKLRERGDGQVASLSEEWMRGEFADVVRDIQRLQKRQNKLTIRSTELPCEVSDDDREGLVCCDLERVQEHAEGIDHVVIKSHCHNPLVRGLRGSLRSHRMPLVMVINAGGGFLGVLWRPEDRANPRALDRVGQDLQEYGEK